MANYICKSRTNYFRVTDEGKLRDLVEKIDDAELWTKGAMFAFGGNNSMTEYFVEDSEWPVDVAEELQKLLPENEVVIITEIGNEKFNYLSASSVVITSKEINHICLDELSVKLAKEMVGDADKEIFMNY